VLGVVGVASLSWAGCAARSAVAEREIAGLRARVAELESSRRQLNSQIKALDDRIVAMEARRGGDAPRRLPVVRVRPREDEGGDEGVHEDETPPEAVAASSRFDVAGQGVGDDEGEPVADDGQRPVLKLYESPRPALVFSDASGPRRRIDLASVNERLPVVPMPEGNELGSEAMPAPFEPEAPAVASPEELMAQARRQVQSGQCAEAINGLGAVLSTSPEHPAAAEAMLLRARCFRREGAHLRALGEAERMVRRYPSSAQAAEALLEVAESYASLGDLERARDIFGQVMRRYPSSNAARRATARVQELGRGGHPREDR
jgi:TolA-binding protein